MEMEYVFEAWLTIQNQFHQNCSCTCNTCLPIPLDASVEEWYCHALDGRQGLHSFINSLLCEKEYGVDFHRVSCIDGSCGSFGINILFPHCQDDMLNHLVVEWRCFMDVPVDGGKNRRPNLTFKKNPMDELVVYLKMKMPHYL